LQRSAQILDLAESPDAVDERLLQFKRRKHPRQTAEFLCIDVGHSDCSPSLAQEARLHKRAIHEGPEIFWTYSLRSDTDANQVRRRHGRLCTRPYPRLSDQVCTVGAV